METLLEVNNLNVQYKSDDTTVYAVNGVSFSLEKGKTLGLIGETGAGKTSIALAITRLLPKNNAEISEGEIFLEGKNLVTMSEKELLDIRGSQISMIFQDPMTALNPVLTVGSQIAEILQIHSDMKKAEVEKEVDRLFELVGIPSSRKKDYPNQFSGGMKQRIVIAIALACNPKLLIADEPTTALDVTIQAQVLEMMDNLKKELNTAMIFITHDLGIVAESCDFVSVMYAGEIVEYGTVRDILGGKNLHPYTKGLLESVPQVIDTSVRLQPIEGLMPNPSELPSGCKFHPRCKQCMEICKTQIPPEVREGSHMIKCHLFAE